VIGGSYIYSAEYCYYLSVPAFGFAARIGTGAAGRQILPPGSWTTTPSTGAAALAPIPKGGLGMLSDNEHGCPLRGESVASKASLLTDSGALSTANDPARPQLPNLAATVGVDGGGRMLVLEGPGTTDFSNSVKNAGWKLIRLLPNGGLDSAFGTDGGMPLPGFGEESVTSIAVDSRGRALVGGGSHRFRVVRIGTKAKIDHSFGSHGWTEAGFGKGTAAELVATTIDRQGRILAVGRVTSEALKTGQGIGLIRFLPGS
jgi:hypothetical protein